MKILGIEASAKACSVAYCQGDKLVSQQFLHSGLTHSRTLLPMIHRVLEESEITLEDLDCLAVAVGPGSFTGLRIAVATVKGLSWACDVPCVPCSTLASMAWQLAHMEGYTIVSVMDARKNQVYTNRFLVQDGKLEALSQDGAKSLCDLAEELKEITTPKILVGDGAALAMDFLEGVKIAPAHLSIQTAWGVVQEASVLCKAGKSISAQDLMPEYHRLSQAERERLEKTAANPGSV